MTTGAVSRNISAPTGVLRGMPIYQKEWSGADSADHTMENAYWMVSHQTYASPCVRKNPYYPYVPAEFYVYLGLPSLSTLKGLKDTTNGNTDLKALARLQTAIKGHEFNSATAFADIEKTSDLLVQAVRNAVGAYRALQQRNFSQFQKHLVAGFTGTPSQRAYLKKTMERKTLAEVWLSAQYGWKPLISDVIAAFDAVRALREGNHEIRYKASSKLPSGTYGLGVSRNLPYASCVEKVSYRLKLTASLTTAQSLGLTPAGWATVVWERVPFSFVLDWFIPIGQTLEQYAFFTNLSFSLCRTRFRQYQFEAAGLVYSNPPEIWSKGSSKGLAVTMKREVNLTSMGLVLPKLNPLSKALGAQHLLNAAAIITLLSSSKMSAPRRNSGNASWGF